MAVAERSLPAAALERPHRDRHMVLLHVGEGRGHLHLGPGLSEGLRRYISCDARVRAVFESEGKPVSVGRAFRTLPERRIVVEDRDRGCRVPGCDRSRRLHWAPTPPIWSRRAATITGCTTEAGWASRATATSPTAWSSPTSGAGGWRAAAGRRPQEGSRPRPGTGARRAASASISGPST